MGILTDSHSQQTTYYPYRTSRFDISVEVRDPYYTRTAQQSVTVLPIATPGYTVHSRYRSFDVFLLPSYGFTGYGPIRTFDNQIWYSAMGSLFTPNFSGYGQPLRAYAAFPVNYAVRGDRVFIARGRTGIDIMRTDDGWNVLSAATYNPLRPTRSTDTTVVDVYYRDSTLFFAYGVEGIYACDMSNLSSPVKVGQYANGDYWGNFVVDGDLLYGLLPRTNRLAILDISNASSMVLVTTVALEGSSFTLITKTGDLISVAKPESIAVYDVSTVTSPMLMSTIPLTKTHLTQSRFWTVGGYGNHLLAGTHEGTYVYDISSPSVPTLIGRFITGYANPRVFLNERRMIVAQADWLSEVDRPERLEGHLEFDTPITGAEEPASRTPVFFALHQNYPNPFNPSTTIRYGLPSRSHVTLNVFNTLGQQVETLVDGEMEGGYHKVKFDAGDLASGVYLYRLQAGDFVQSRKLLLLK